MWYCVPTHTVRMCDIFCILVLIWAEELNARTKQMGTKAFHLWAPSLYERQWPGCQPLKCISDVLKLMSLMGDELLVLCVYIRVATV